MGFVTIFNRGIGLNNKVAPYRLPFDIEQGVSALQRADNVLIDKTGGIAARRGYVTVEEGQFHSLYPGKDWGLVVKDRQNDSALYKVVVSRSGEVSLYGVRSGLTLGKKVDYCFLNNNIFYSNGFENGMVDSDGVSRPWKENQWYNPETIVGFTSPPPAHHLACNAGRIFFSINNVLYYTEYGMPGLYDPKSNGEVFRGKITGIIPALDGIYVSDENYVFFLSGLNPKKWTSRMVLNYPVLEWGVSRTTIHPILFGIDSPHPAWCAATKKGPVLFLPGGDVINLIENNVIMPDCSNSGAIMVVDETLIIQTGE